MSTLGHEIRAQETVANHLASRLSTTASDIRTRARTTTWDSIAGDHFRSTLGVFATDIEVCRGEVVSLAGALASHATAVEHHETMLAAVTTSVADAPGDIARGLEQKIGGGR